MALKKGKEIATIDVVLVTIEVPDETNPIEIALNTSSKIAVSVQSETEDAVKLIVKGRLIAQKPATVTITGNTVVLTDNVFNPDVVKVLQGGTIMMSTEEGHTTEILSYEPPVAGSDDKGQVFKLCAYSAIYDAAGLITGYEKINYPNCQGTPIALNSEDNVFRAPEYTINSAPKIGEAPYKIEYIKVLPVVS